MQLTALIDKALPGPGSTLDRVSRKTHTAVRSVVDRPGLKSAATALRGNEWLGHPLHPVVVAWPIGAWVVSAWYDAKSARTNDVRDEYTADAALRVGALGALAAATTGLVQYVDTEDQSRRETAVHAALNNFALVMYLLSLAMRRSGRRSSGRKLAVAGLSIVSISGWLGGDIAFRHGVGVRSLPRA